MKKILNLIIRRKFTAAIIIIVLIGAGYFAYKKFNNTSQQTHYFLSAVERGTVISSVSGTGQVSVSDEIDIKPKASGDLIYVGVKNGQKVSAGALIAEIDPTDAKKAVQDAQVNLDQAKLDLEKMKGMQTELGDLRGVKEKATDALAKSYEDGFNDIANAFLDLPSIVSGLNDILYSFTISRAQSNIEYYAGAVRGYDLSIDQYKADAISRYQTARTAYEKNFQDYKAVDRTSNPDKIEALISETYDTTRDVAEAVKSTINLIQFYQDKLVGRGITPVSTSGTHLSSLNSYTGETNSYLSTLLSIKDTIQTNKETLIETDFDIADQEIQVKKMQDALDDAEKSLSYCYIYAPFDGVVSAVNVQKGDSVSSGTAVATLITKKMIATVSLNEVDAAKIKVGQKVNLTFDAIEDLTMTGVVVDIDTVGTVSQGVVSYKVTISFDTQNDKVKPGMSVSAVVITDTKQDVLLVPSGAVKSKNGDYYVETLSQKWDLTDKTVQAQGVVSSTSPNQKTVQTGISDDTSTEIISGLSEGDQVVARTSSSQTKTTQTTNSTQRLFNGGGSR